MSNSKIIKQKITDTLKENYMPYAMSVIISRAIPEIDGFKPAHRKLLYTMYDMGLMRNGAKYVKCANIVGAGMKLNPHGDASIYDTMVRMTVSNETLLFPLVDSKGSFGKHYSRDMAPAAYRYTEARLTKSCETLFRDIDKNAVDFVDNYDGTMKEPSLLPVLFPLILVNPNQGIAVGMASNICSFNLTEVCNTTIALLKNKNANIYETLLAPDFTTGGELLYNDKEIKSIYETGKGSFKVKSVWSYDKKNRIIEITEIPFSTTVENIIDKIIDLVKSGKIKEIDNVRDETGLNGLKIAIDLKRGSNPDDVMNKLFKYTPLIDSFACNFNVLINGNPKVMGIKDILLNWIDFRVDCLKKAFAYDLEKKKYRLHLLNGLELVLLDIDKVIKIISSAPKDSDVVPLLMQRIKVDEIQATYIADIKLRNLNKDYILNLTKNIDSLKNEISELETLLDNDKKIKNIIAKELKDIIKKYGQPRKTKIINNFNVEEINEIVEEIVPFTSILTKEHYVKKILQNVYRITDEQKLKEGDQIFEILENPKEILIFNDKGEVYKKQLSEISDMKSSSLGEFLPSKIEISNSENIIFSCFLEKDKYLLFCFENGKIAKIPMSSYETLTNRKKLINAYYTNSKLIGIIKGDNNDSVVISLNNGKSKTIPISKISEKTTKNTQGVQVITNKTLKPIKIDILKKKNTSEN